MRRRVLELSIAFLGQLAFTVVATWPLFPGMATKAAYDRGDPLLSAWLFGWGAHRIVDAPLRIFDANMFFPQGLTLAFTENMLGLSLPVAPIFWITGNALLAENVALLLYTALAGFGAYLLVREVGAPPLLAFACGTAYALTPYRLIQYAHPHVVGTHWLPFVALMLVRLSQPDLPRPVVRRRVAALILFATLQTWSSLTGAAMMGVLVGAWLLWCATRSGRRAARPVAHVALGMAAAAVLSVPVLLPYVVVRDRHPDYRHSEQEVLAFSAEPASYLSPGDSRELAEKRVFPGVWLLGAFVAGVVVTARQRFRDASLAVLGLVVAGVFFVFSLGPRTGGDRDGLPLPFLALQEAFGGLTRVPSRFGIVVPLGLALVAGAGLARLPRRACTVVAAASLLVVAVESIPRTMPVVSTPRITAAHRAVADREGVVLGLPTTELDDAGAIRYETLALDAQHLFLSTAHFRPLVNGYAAYHPGSYWAVVQAVQDFPSPAAFTVLKSRDVRTVVVQTDLVETTTRWRDVVERLRTWPGVTEIASGTNVRVYDIAGATSAG